MASTLQRSPAGQVARRALTSLTVSFAALLLGACAANPAQPDGGDDKKEPSMADRVCDPPRHEFGDADEQKVVDNTRKLLETTSCHTAMWLDGLLGDEPDRQAARRTSGDMELSYNYSEYWKSDTNLRMHVDFDLPAVQNHLSAFVGRENADDYARDRTEGFDVRSQYFGLEDNNSWLAGLGYSAPSFRGIDSDFQIGVRGLGPPQLFIRNRFRYRAFSTATDLMVLKATPFWNTDDKFGLTLNADWAHVINDKLIFRWNTYSTRSESTDGASWYSGVALYRRTGDQRGFESSVFLRGETAAPVPLREYGVRLVHRQPVYNGRLFWEWVLGYSWPLEDPEDNRNGAFAIGTAIELPFGVKRARPITPSNSDADNN